MPKRLQSTVASADLIKEGLDVGLELGARALLVVLSEVGLQLPEALQVLPAQRTDEPLEFCHSLPAALGAPAAEGT